MLFFPRRRVGGFGLWVMVGLLLAALFLATSSGNGTTAALGLVAVLSCAVLFLVAPLSTLYLARPEGLWVRWLLGWRAWPRAAIRGVGVREFRLMWRVMGLGVPGAAQGWFNERELGRVEAYVDQGSGLGVVLELADGHCVILTPADLEGFLDYLRRQGYPVA